MSAFKLRYARPKSVARRIWIPPSDLLPPHLIATLLMFVPAGRSQWTPIYLLSVFVFHSGKIVPAMGGVWDWLTATLFCASAPLAAWTVRLVVRPSDPPRRTERLIVWTFAFIALLILLVLACHDLSVSDRSAVTVGTLAGLAMLPLGVAAVWLVRNTFTSYVPPLVALSVALLANEVRVLTFGLVDNEVFLGLIINAVVVVWELIALALLLEEWRALVPVRGRKPWFENIKKPVPPAVPMAKVVRFSTTLIESPPPRPRP